MESVNKQLMFYLKTTDTCQLNCEHCFTNGSRGAKGFFDPSATIDFFRRLRHFYPQLPGGNIAFHGGEPFLCPVEMMIEAWHGIRELWPKLWWSIQTNLTFKLDSKKLDLLNNVCEKSWGTSWDYGIRWTNKRQTDLWRSNVKNLASDGHAITVMVSLTEKVIRELSPIEIIEDLASLGVKYINFERVTANGNALLNRHKGLFPDNRALDAWLYQMWEETVKHTAWKSVENMFLNSLLTSLVYNTHSGCRSRSCEQKILTINASGSIGGCPNGATTKTFGHIKDDVFQVMSAPGRLCNISEEMGRHPVCHTCPVHDICNGDCHQLNWQGDICAAPKTLMTELKHNMARDFSLYKEVLSGFMGQE